MMAAVPHVTSGSGIRKFQVDGFLFDRVYTRLRGVTIQKRANLRVHYILKKKNLTKNFLSRRRRFLTHFIVEVSTINFQLYLNNFSKIFKCSPDP